MCYSFFTLVDCEIENKLLPTKGVLTWSRKGSICWEKTNTKEIVQLKVWTKFGYLFWTFDWLYLLIITLHLQFVCINLWLLRSFCYKVTIVFMLKKLEIVSIKFTPHPFLKKLTIWPEPDRLLVTLQACLDLPFVIIIVVQGRLMHLLFSLLQPFTGGILLTKHLLIL